MTVRAYFSTLGRMRMLAGDPALDFANTLHWREGRQVDFIPDYRSASAWSVAAGLLREAEGDRLCQLADADPHRALATHERLLSLRAVWRQHLCETVGPQAPCVTADLPGPLAETLAGLLSNGHLAMGFGTAADSRGGGASLLLPAVRIALAIASLCLMPIDRQLGRCEGDPCGGFFLNNSRSKPRRWCSMDTCGNRAKVRHFRSRFVAQDAG